MKFTFLNKKSPPINFSFFPNIFNSPQKILKILEKKPEDPIFITDTTIIENRLKLINKSLKTLCPKNPHTIAYSFKTNYDIAKNIKFNQAEIVSKYELDMALKQKYSYNSIIFNGPNKGHLHSLLSHPLTLNLDNFSELNNLLTYKNKIKANIGIRINSNFCPSHFGFNIESGEAQKAILLLRKNNISLNGLHLHIGSDIREPQIYQKYSLILKKFILDNFSQQNIPLKYIDLGGGYPSHSIIPGTQTQSFPDINQYIRSIIIPLKSILDQDTTIILEPGRFLVDDSTVLVGKVIDSKTISNFQTATLNTTINMLPSAWYHQLIIKNYNKNFLPKKNHSKTINTKIYGCTCQESDLLYQGKTPFLTPGDYFVFFCVGAYNQSQSTDFIFQKPESIFI